MGYRDGLGTTLPLIVSLPDGREAWVSLHARERALERIGRHWLRCLLSSFCVPNKWKHADAYVAENGETFVAVDGDGDGLTIVTAYVGPPLLLEASPYTGGVHW